MALASGVARKPQTTGSACGRQRMGADTSPVAHILRAGIPIIGAGCTGRSKPVRGASRCGASAVLGYVALASRGPALHRGRNHAARAHVSRQVAGGAFPFARRVAAHPVHTLPAGALVGAAA